MNLKTFPIIPLLAAAGLCSCQSSYDASKIPAASHPSDGELMIQGVNDPIEPVNRASFALTEGLFDYVQFWCEC